MLIIKGLANEDGKSSVQIIFFGKYKDLPCFQMFNDSIFIGFDMFVYYQGKSKTFQSSPDTLLIISPSNRPIYLLFKQ